MRWEASLKVFNMIKSVAAVNVIAQGKGCKSWQLDDDAPTRLPDSSINSTHESRAVARRAERMTEIWWLQEILKQDCIGQWGLTACCWWSVGLACRLNRGSLRTNTTEDQLRYLTYGAKVYKMFRRIYK